MSNKHSNKREKKKEEKIRQKRSSFPWMKSFLFLSSVLIVVTSYYLYNVITTPASLPKVNYNEWWGSYPMDVKQDLSIRPFKIEFPDLLKHDLRERLLQHRPLTPPLEGAGFTYGFNTKFLEQVLDYWRRYNFEDREIFFNKYNHYITNIQGLDVHFIHVKPKMLSKVKVIPLLLLHGWPSSIREWYELIPKFTTPNRSNKFVFEIIAPSIPGTGFSQAASRPGFGFVEVAVIMQKLMDRLGHEQYYVHGSDWGHLIGANMATLFPHNVLGFHTSTPLVMFHPLTTVYTFLGSLWPSLLVDPGLESRLYPLSEKLKFQIEESGYIHLQATKPDTIGVALTDSPSGLAAYILEKFSTWTNPDYRKSRDGNLVDKFSLNILLDNVMIYWVSNSITTSMRMYAETFAKKQLAYNIDQVPTYVPVWGIKFKYDVVYHPDVILKLKFKNYLQSTIVEDGGHFAAYEHPDILVDDIFKAVETFEDFNKQSEQENDVQQQKTIYEFSVKDINGNMIKLDKYKGKVLLIVNVASQCGLTDTNYKQLNHLYEKYSKSGLRILAFPCNQFGGQEPGNLKDISAFIKEKGVKFDVFEKVDVNGENAHPLWEFLKNSQGGTLGEFIKWNFSKFIVDKNGFPVERFGPTTSPFDLEPNLMKYL